jgi:hypothetical protein
MLEHSARPHAFFSTKVYDGVVTISCEVLAALARSKLLPDWRTIDFNVSEVGDKIDTIIKRDQQIRRLIEHNG